MEKDCSKTNILCDIHKDISLQCSKVYLIFVWFLPIHQKKNWLE